MMLTVYRNDFFSSCSAAVALYYDSERLHNGNFMLVNKLWLEQRREVIYLQNIGASVVESLHWEGAKDYQNYFRMTYV